MTKPSVVGLAPIEFDMSIMDVLQFQSLSMSLLLDLIDTIVKRFHFVFLLHEFKSRFSKQVISVPSRRDFATFAGLENLMKRFFTPQNLLMSERKTCSIGKRFLIQPILA